VADDEQTYCNIYGIIYFKRIAVKLLSLTVE